MYQINTAILGARGVWQNMSLGLVYLGTMLTMAAAYVALIVSAFVFVRRALHTIDGRPRLAWCIMIVAVLAGIAMPAQFMLGGWLGSSLWPQLNVYSWPFYLVHVILVLSLHLLPLFVAIGLAFSARDAKRVRLVRLIACAVTLKCFGVVSCLVADAIDTMVWSGTGGSLARWAYSMQTPTAWVAWAWPWFDQLCMLLLGLAALLLARSLARHFRQALANANTTRMPHVDPDT